MHVQQVNCACAYAFSSDFLQILLTVRNLKIIRQNIYVICHEIYGEKTKIKFNSRSAHMDQIIGVYTTKVISSDELGWRAPE